MRDMVKPGRYAMFLRKSREDIEAEREGKYETLAQHEAKLSRLADDMGIRVVHVYKDLVSGGSLDDCMAAIEMLEDVRSGMYDGVLAYDLQRITRGDMADQGKVMRVFAYSGTLIVTPSNVFDLSDEIDESVAELDMIYGRRELRRITRRLIDGKEERTRQGQYLGSIAPYGWSKVQEGRKKTLVPSDDHERLLHWYEDIASWSRSPEAIADEMNMLGIPTPRGKHWDHGTVRYILSNPINKGYVRWNQKKTVTVLAEDMSKRKARRRADSKEMILVEGLHRGRGLITDELWEAANEQLRRHTISREYSLRPLQNPLAGLLVCAHCGRVMMRIIGRPGGKGSPEECRYAHPKSNRYECTAMSAPVDMVVNLVIESLAEAAEDIEVMIADDSDARAARVEARMAELDKAAAAEESAVGNLFRLAEKGLISDEEFAERKKMADARRSGIGKERAKMAREVEDAAANEERVVGLRRSIEELRNYKGRAKEVNEALKSVIRSIEYEKDPQTKEIHLKVFLH